MNVKGNIRKSRLLSKGVLFWGVFTVLVFGSGTRAAPTFSFTRITSNTPEGSVLPMISMSVEEYTLSDSRQGVLFTFGLSGPGTISQIYFEDGTLLGVAEIIDSPPNVDFYVYDDPANKNGINPANLPGGQDLSVPFAATQALSVELNGKTSTGLSSGETLGIAYTLQSGLGYADVLDAMALGLTDPSQSGTLRVGVHVRELGPGGEYSDSFVVVPAPGSILLGCFGVVLVGRLRRRHTFY